jgi:hypothetical protein
MSALECVVVHDEVVAEVELLWRTTRRGIRREENHVDVRRGEESTAQEREEGRGRSNERNGVADTRTRARRVSMLSLRVPARLRARSRACARLPRLTRFDRGTRRRSIQRGQLARVGDMRKSTALVRRCTRRHCGGGCSIRTATRFHSVRRRRPIDSGLRRELVRLLLTWFKSQAAPLRKRQCNIILQYAYTLQSRLHHCGRVSPMRGL